MLPLTMAVPWYVRALLAAAFALSLVAFGFVRGVRYEADSRDAAEAKAAAEGVRILTREVTKIEVRYVDRKAKREAERATVNQEVVDHAAKLPDPPACWLDPARVRTINRAWAAADPGVQAVPMQGAGGAAIR
jgi:hypothetical protein